MSDLSYHPISNLTAWDRFRIRFVQSVIQSAKYFIPLPLLGVYTAYFVVIFEQTNNVSNPIFSDTSFYTVLTFFLFIFSSLGIILSLCRSLFVGAFGSINYNATSTSKLANLKFFTVPFLLLVLFCYLVYYVTCNIIFPHLFSLGEYILFDLLLYAPPNDKFKFLVNNLLDYLLRAGLIHIIIYHCILFVQDEDLLDISFKKNKPYNEYIESLFTLNFAIIDHILLRYLLFIRGYLPFRLVKFLNEMTRLHILESDGISWRFRHSMIREYLIESKEKEA